MTNIFCVCLLFAMVLHGMAQMGSDMQLIFQELGVESPELPPMPPKMPQSLREHLYPNQRRQQQQQQQQRLRWQLHLQRQRQLAALQAAQVQQGPPNPYSITYRQSRDNLNSKQVNSVYSAANRIRTARRNGMGLTGKTNPYSRATANKINPYSKPRYSNSRGTSPTIAPQMRAPMIYSTLRQARDMDKMINEAQLAGCKLPFEAPAAMVLGTCKTPEARLVCQSMLMSCQDVGLVPMCCPYGMNKLTRDTFSYVKKLQSYVSEVA